MNTDNPDARKVYVMRRRLLVLVTIAFACALLTVFGLVASAVFANRATKQFFDRDYRLKRSYQDALKQFRRDHPRVDPASDSSRELINRRAIRLLGDFKSKYYPPEASRNQGIANIYGVIGILGLIGLVICLVFLVRSKWPSAKGKELPGHSEVFGDSKSDTIAPAGRDAGTARSHPGGISGKIRVAFFAPSITFLVMGLLFGMLMLVINPPFRTADENAHFARAYSIAEGELFSVVRPGESGFHKGQDAVGSYIPDSFRLLWSRTGFRPPKTPRIRTSEITSALNIPLGSKHNGFSDFGPFGSSTAPPCCYLPQALGIALGRLFHLSTLMLLYMGRFANLLFFLLLVFIAIKMTPVLKWTFVLLGLMPMTINLVASLSYDGPVIALSFLFIAYLLYLALEGRKQQVIRRDLYFLFALAVLLALIKQPYFLLVVFFLAIPSSRFKSRKTYYRVFALLLVLVIVVAGAWILVVGKQHPVSSVSSHSGTILAHPLKFVTTILRTLNLNKLYWTQGFVGILGWNEVPLPLWFAFTYIFFIISVAALDKDDIEVRPRQKVMGSAALLALFLAIFAIFYLNTSFFPTGATTVGGIYSRYFIPIAPLFFLLFYNTKIRYDKGKWFYVIVLGFSVFSMALTMIKLVSRYYY